MNVILGAHNGLSLGTFALDWGSRSGRSLRALTTTLAQTGFRKGEVSVDRAGQPCSFRCVSRGSLRWLLRGKIYTSRPPLALLRDPIKRGDFAVLVPPPSKTDPFDMVWGGNPTWLPFQPGEPLCAFSALAHKSKFMTRYRLTSSLRPSPFSPMTTGEPVLFLPARLHLAPAPPPLPPSAVGLSLLLA